MAMHPSVSYAQATDIREAVDRNFLVVLSDVGTRGGGGTLATFNRSIGPFEADRNDVQFLQVADHCSTRPRPDAPARRRGPIARRSRCRTGASWSATTAPSPI